jgi:hypothetical protein
MTREKPYSLIIEGDRLIFTTSFYRADKGSVLHKEIYNYELASMMTGIIICGALYVIIAFNFEVMIIHYIALVLLFMLLFILLRRSVFREKYLTLIVDRGSDTASLSTPGFFGEKKEEIRLSGIDDIEVGSVSVFPEDRDAARFVEKISRQHGSVVPGLADEAEFVTLSLRLNDGTERLIYAAKIEAGLDGEPDVPLKEIRSFIDKL